MQRRLGRDASKVGAAVTAVMLSIPNQASIPAIMYINECYTRRIYTEEASTINQQRGSLEDSETKPKQ